MYTILINQAPHGHGPGIVALAQAVRIMEIGGIPKDRYRIIFPLINADEVLDHEYGRLSLTEKIFLRDQPFSDLNIYFDRNLGLILNKLNFKDKGNYGHRLETILKEQRMVQNNINDYLNEKLITTQKMGNGEFYYIDPSTIDFVLGHNPIVIMNPGSTKEQLPQFFSTIAPFSKLLTSTVIAQKLGMLSLDYEIPEPQILIDIAQGIENAQTLFFTSTPSTLTCVGNEQSFLNSIEYIVPPFKDQVNPNQDISEEGIFVIRSGINVPHLLQKLDDIVAYAKDQGLKVYSHDGEAKGEIYANETVCAHPKIKAVVGRLGLGAVYIAHVHNKPFISFPFQPHDDPEMFFNELTFTRNGTVLLGDSPKPLFDKLDECAKNVKDVYETIRIKFGTLSGNDIIARTIGHEIQSLFK